MVQGQIVKIIPSSHHCGLASPEFNGNPHPRPDNLVVNSLSGTLLRVNYATVTTSIFDSLVVISHCFAC